jgi:hypothetical protein
VNLLEAALQRDFSVSLIEISRKTWIIGTRDDVFVLSGLLMCRTIMLFDIFGAVEPFTSRWILFQFSASPFTLLGAVFTRGGAAQGESWGYSRLLPGRGLPRSWGESVSHSRFGIDA